MELTPYEIAKSLLGVKERPGREHEPMVQAMLACCSPRSTPYADEVPWCSAFISFCAMLARHERSRSLRARSWLKIGQRVDDVRVGDIAILSRPPNPRSGHVGFVHGVEGERVILLGGNQSNAVTLARFVKRRVVGVRRLRPE